MVTWQDLFSFILLLIELISLMLLITEKKK